MAKVGNNTKDVCRHCGEKIVWVQDGVRLPSPTSRDPDATRWLSKHWVHAESASQFTDMSQLRCKRDDPDRLWGGQSAEPVNFCAETLSGGYGTICNRGVQDPEVMACGIHAKNLLLEKRERERRAEARLVDEYVRKEVDALVEKVKELGLLSAKIDYPASSGRITVEASEFVEWLLELKPSEEDE